MSKTVVFLADGMADEGLGELNGKTPLQAVPTPWMDSIAERGASGLFLTLPKGYPTSSDAANLSVLGYDLSKDYPGRGPLEAASRGIQLAKNDVAWRCNLVHTAKGVLVDYSAGHIDSSKSKILMEELQKRFGDQKVSFHPGVSYRNLLVLHGEEFTDKVKFHKPDSSQGEPLEKLGLSPENDSKEAAHTVEFLNELILKTSEFLSGHSLCKTGSNPPNMIWPWSPGKKPNLPLFSEKYKDVKGAVISAVDVISGIAICTGMDVIRVEGATGFVDTNYDGKAQAAINALKDHDFVYLHLEAIDECSHIGDLNMKLAAISDFDSKIVGPVMKALKNQDVTFAVLPDHPVPVKLRKHTRTPVPVAICGKHIVPDRVTKYSEIDARAGSLGFMKGDMFMKKLLSQ